MISTVAFLRPVEGLVVGVSVLSEPPVMSFSSETLSVFCGSLVLMGSSSGWVTVFSVLLALFEVLDNSPMRAKMPQTATPARTTGIIILMWLVRFFVFFDFFIEVESSLLLHCSTGGVKKQ